MWVCPNGHLPEEVIVVVSETDDQGRVSSQEFIMANRLTGEITNRFYDGIVGVTKELRELAESEDVAACPECHEQCTWKQPDFHALIRIPEKKAELIQKALDGDIDSIFELLGEECPEYGIIETFQAKFENGLLAHIDVYRGELADIHLLVRLENPSDKSSQVISDNTRTLCMQHTFPLEGKTCVLDVIAHE